MIQPNTFLSWLKNNIFNLLTGLIIIFCVYGRVTIYGDPRYSIATHDSSSYYSQANIPVLSWEAFTGRRLPTYPFFFKMLEPPDGTFEPTAISYPALPDEGTKNKAFQPDFVRVVLVQFGLSIAAWVFFAIIIAKRLRYKVLRPLAAGLILVFAFTPSLAEWDSIIMSESISFSLFIVLAALTVEILFRVMKEKNNPGWITKILIVFWMVLIPFWAFTRDTNSNTLIIPIVFFVIFLIVPKIRKNIPIYWVIGVTIYLAALSFLYSTATLAANRWVWGWKDIYNVWLVGYPEREKFFIDRGMPQPWTAEWVDTAGPKTYLEFLFNHPGFMVTELLGSLSNAFSENLQPYFFTNFDTNRKVLIAIGDFFHPLSSVSFFFPLVGGILVCLTSIKNFGAKNLPWLIFVLWLIGMTYGLFLAAFFGDPAGLIRHTLGAVVNMRMMIWLLPIIIADMALTTKEKI